MFVDRSTLLLIPCCASKLPSGDWARQHNDPLAGCVSVDGLGEVLKLRQQVLSGVLSDPLLVSDNFSKNLQIRRGADFGSDSTVGRYLPAIERYQGTLYSVPGVREAIKYSLAEPSAPRLLILSALYGPLHPLTPIQDYNLMMGQRPARHWQRGFSSFLTEYVRTNGVRRIVMFFGSSTAYLSVARAAVLNSASELDEAVQFHVIDGSTRNTPLQHGRLLRSLLTKTLPDLSGVELNRIVGAAPQIVKEAACWSSNPVVSQNDHIPDDFGQSHNSVVVMPPTVSTMRRAPPPEEKGSVRRRLPASALASTAIQVSKHEPLLQPRHSEQLSGMPGATIKGESRSPENVRLTSGRDPYADANHFRSMLKNLSTHQLQNLTLAELMRAGRLPDRGVYFFLDGDDAAPASELRVCRIGTHAVSAGSKSTLRARLRAHFGNNSGMGNHRGSIFRLHVGNALLRRAGHAIATWGLGSSAPEQLRTSEALQHAEAEHESRVSDYIGKLRVLWVDVPDAAGPTSERSYIERNAIALLAEIGRGTDTARSSWLGLHSPREEIRSSMLWNLNYVGDRYDPAFLGVLHRAIERTAGMHVAG